MHDSSKSEKNQANPKQYTFEVLSVSKKSPESASTNDVTFLGSVKPNLEYRDLTSNEPAPIRTWVANPFDQLYHMDDAIYDNATPEVQEIVSDAQQVRQVIENVTEKHFEAPTIDDLDFMTQGIKHNQLSYVRDGCTLYQIKVLKLYKHKYRSLNEYAQVEIGMTASRVDQLIASASVSLKLIAAGHTKLPLNSFQAYTLRKLNDEELVRTWEQIISSHAMHEITAEKIKMMAYPPEVSKVLKGTSISVNPSVYEQLVVNALKKRIPITDYIQYLLTLQKCKFSFFWNLAKFQT